MSRLDHIGRSAPRPEAPDKASGRAHYIQDIVRPGMLHGRVKFSEHPHARIKSIDTSQAENLPGVRAVVTALNTPEIRIGFLQDNFVLKQGKVRQYRDELAAVAAIDPDIAAEAIDLIEVEYEPLAGVFTVEEALAKEAVLVHDVDVSGKPRKNNIVPVSYQHLTGDLEAAKRASWKMVEGTYSTPLIQQSCLGTAGCIAEFDMSGHLTVWSKTQIPFLAQRDFMKALESMGLKGRNVRVVVPAVGGAFGTGLDTHAYEYLAILLAYQSGRPVRIVYTREEEFACLSPRQSAKTHIVQGCDQTGRLTFRQIEVTQDNGAYTSWGATFPSVMLLPATSLYRVPTVSFKAQLVYTNNTYCQAMRGYGNPEVTWPIESSLDELAEVAGIDPLKLRLINTNEPGETTPMGLKITSCGLKSCLEQTGLHLDWRKRRGKSKNEYRGVGLASLIHVGGGGKIYRSDGSGIILKLDDYGNVNVSYGGVEIGQGLHTAIRQAVAEALGVLPESVHVNQTDTATCPWDVGTHASRGAFMACNAAIMAAEKLRKRLFGLAEDVFFAEAQRNLGRLRKQQPRYRTPRFDIQAAANQDNFELKDGWLFLKDHPDEPWLRVEFGRLLRAIHFRDRGTMLTEEAFYEPPTELPDWSRGRGNMSATYAFGTQGAEVEVDTETGEVKILRLVAVHDVGRVINPETLSGQIYGALAQGVGYALYEEVLSDEGRILNPSFTDYKIPTACEMDFPIELEFIETDDPEGPFGAKGVGEPGLVPTAPAIANAIYDAIGVRIRDLPITPEKVLAALKDKQRNGR